MAVLEGVAVTERWLADDADPVTFEQYVAKRSPSLLRFAFLVTHNREDAHDAVHDALAGLYPRWQQVSRTGRVDAYVRRSVVNASVSRWRRGRRSTPVADPSLGSRAPVVADPAEAIADADAALRLCAELPPTQRAAVVLRFYEDRSFAEIGDILGCPEATARSHVHRALVTLRTRLDARPDDE